MPGIIPLTLPDSDSGTWAEDGIVRPRLAVSEIVDPAGWLIQSASD